MQQESCVDTLNIQAYVLCLEDGDTHLRKLRRPCPKKGGFLITSKKCSTQTLCMSLSWISSVSKSRSSEPQK